MRHTLAASVLLSSMLLTASAVAQPATDDAAPAQDLRVSTGVTPPTVVSSVPIEVPASIPVFGKTEKVVVAVKVDEKGRPGDVQVIRSSNLLLDKYVEDAVSKFRFQPASLDNEAVPVDMQLNVQVEK